MVFFVHEGKVTVDIEDVQFGMTKGGVWQVPRGKSFFFLFSPFPLCFLLFLFLVSCSGRCCGEKRKAAVKNLPFSATMQCKSNACRYSAASPTLEVTPGDPVSLHGRASSK